MISRTERTLTYAILGLFTVISLTPVVGILSSAFGERSSLDTGFSLPSGLNWGNFSEAWTRGHFGSYLTNSLLVAAAVVTVTTVLATLAAYGLGAMRFPAPSCCSTSSSSGSPCPRKRSSSPSTSTCGTGNSPTPTGG